MVAGHQALPCSDLSEESMAPNWPTAEGDNIQAKAQRLVFIHRRKIWAMKECKTTLMKKNCMNGTHLAKRRNLMNKGRMFVCVLKGEV